MQNFINDYRDLFPIKENPLHKHVGGQTMQCWLQCVLSLITLWACGEYDAWTLCLIAVVTDLLCGKSLTLPRAELEVLTKKYCCMKKRKN